MKVGTIFTRLSLSSLHSFSFKINNFDDNMSSVYQSCKNFYTIVRERPVDAIAHVFVLICSVLTYYCGTFDILPKLMQNQSVLLLYPICALTTWIVVAIYSNMFLARLRDSSIRNRMLLQPTIKTPCFGAEEINRSRDDEIKEQTRRFGQQFMAKPFGEEENWHICSKCEIYVPPRAWHCQHCKTCILRRDHHCVFTMCCVGEENHFNFLGLVFYIAFGTTLATTINMLYTRYFTETPLWLYVVKAFVPFYTIIFDFSVINLLAGVNLLGLCAAWVVFINYVILALRGQTCADRSLGVKRTIGCSLKNMRNFLGPNPIWRILWPFHPVLKLSYNIPTVQEDAKDL